jgi:hypothetical protein
MALNRNSRSNSAGLLLSVSIQLQGIAFLKKTSLVFGGRMWQKMSIFSPRPFLPVLDIDREVVFGGMRDVDRGLKFFALLTLGGRRGSLR